MSYDIKTLPAILTAAIESARSATTKGSVGGCGRVYIVLSEVPRANSKIYKIFGNYGFKFMNRPYSTRKCIYMGYDNATGKEWYQAEAAAKVFKDNGISCYVDGDGD